jgi:uncharacterized iron-regulated membrane protein
VLATVHLHILHHTLDPLGIVLAALCLAVVVVSVSVIAAWLIKRHARVTDPAANTPSGDP